MAKVCFLTMALSAPNTKKLNKEALLRTMESFPDVDHIFFEQEFEPDDFIDSPRVKYIAGNPKRQGFIPPRNALLKWFYNSDYDYAIFRDAGDVISKPTSNDFATLLDAVKNDKLPKLPLIQTTIGIVVDGDRMALKQASDYFDNITVKPCTNNNGELHFAFHLNYKKYYGDEPYIHPSCTHFNGISDDRYFVLLLKTLYGCWCCPTVMSGRMMGGASASTWAPGKTDGKMGYPPIDFKKTMALVYQEIEANGWKFNKYPNQDAWFKIPRLEQYKELLKPYKPRKKKIKESEGDLF